MTIFSTKDRISSINGFLQNSVPIGDVEIKRQYPYCYFKIDKSDLILDKDKPLIDYKGNAEKHCLPLIYESGN